jgi:hypothetical protein
MVTAVFERSQEAAERGQSLTYSFRVDKHVEA